MLLSTVIAKQNKDLIALTLNTPARANVIFDDQWQTTMEYVLTLLVKPGLTVG